MTTVAMVAGMVTAALGIGEGGEVRQPVAIAVVGGLSGSTGLPLLPTPVDYLYVDNFELWLKPRLGTMLTPRFGFSPTKISAETR